MKDVPPDKHRDLDYNICMLNWDASVDPEFAKHRWLQPKPVRDSGEMTRDELFVTAPAARAGVAFTNRSDKEKLVLLRHFGSGNPDAAGLIEARYN